MRRIYPINAFAPRNAVAGERDARNVARAVASRKRQRGRHRLSVLSRVLAAVFGGYAAATILAIALAAILPTSRADAVQTAGMLSFLFYAAAATWVFAARSPRQAWMGLLAAGALSGLLVWFFM